MYNNNDNEKWSEGTILPFSKKGDLGVPKNYRGITLTPIATKICNALLLNRMQLSKLSTEYSESISTVVQILTVRRIVECIRAKDLPEIILFVGFLKAFGSVHRGKLQSSMKACEKPDEIVNVVMMLYKNEH